jgi:glyoxylase-like metal-dependent hydrolase (beta-lactamase superfamily II)
MDKSLAKYGFHRDDVTDVFTHLHFDHCGGSVQWNAEKRDEPAFKNAKFWNESHWEWATNRTLGESIFPFENILPMQESGQLNFIKDLQRIF